jgi:hypothetical protein
MPKSSNARLSRPTREVVQLPIRLILSDFFSCPALSDAFHAKSLRFKNLAGKRLLLPSNFALKSIYCSSVRERDGVSLCYSEVKKGIHDFHQITRTFHFITTLNDIRIRLLQFAIQILTFHSPSPPFPARQTLGLVKMTPLVKTTFLPDPRL